MPTFFFSFLFCWEYDVLIFLVSVITTDCQKCKINQDYCINPTKRVGLAVRGGGGKSFRV